MHAFEVFRPLSSSLPQRLFEADLFFALFEADVGWGAVRWRNMNFQIHKLRVAANGVTVRARRISSGGRCRPDLLRTVIVQIFCIFKTVDSSPN